MGTSLLTLGTRYSSKDHTLYTEEEEGVRFLNHAATEATSFGVTYIISDHLPTFFQHEKLPLTRYNYVIST